MDQDREDQTKTRAYQIWEEEGRPEGRHDDHWSRAEQEHGTDLDPDLDQSAETNGSPSKDTVHRSTSPGDEAK